MTKVVHCKRAPYDEYIGRPSRLGNPFSHKSTSAAEVRVATVEEAVSRFREWFRSRTDLVAYARSLRGKTLGCWCKIRGHEPCHGDIIAETADADTVCEDCGTPTVPGDGSARCRECWDSRVGREV